MTNPTDDSTPTTPEVAATPATAPAAPRRRRWVPVAIGAGAGLAVLALGVGGVAIVDAFDHDGDDDRVPVSVESPDGSRDGGDAPARDDVVDRDDEITDEEFERVSEAALAAAGGGTVTDIDRSDDPGEAWEVEVRLDNGDEVDVELAEDYSVVRTDLDPRD